MPKSKSSRRWLQEHHSDKFVRQAKQQGLRSRAAYKLLALQEKDRILRSGMTVVDLGAAPGGWSQVAKQCVGEKGLVFALDILPMDSLAGVELIQGDFTEQKVLDCLLEHLEGQAIDIVISDMAPNASGIKDVDQARAMYLAELALDFVERVLRPNGSFVVKVFQGEGFDAYLKQVRSKFTKVFVRKPPASRARSTEVYFVAKGFKKG